MIVELDTILKGTIIVIGLFLFYYFVSNRETRSNYWLALMNLSIALHFTNLFLIDRFHLSHFGLVFGLCYGPLIFFFVKSHFDTGKSGSGIHFLPAGLLLAWVLSGEYFKLTTTDIELVLLQAVVFIHIGVYILFAFHISKQYLKIAFQTRSQLHDDKIKLIQKSILYIGLLFFISMIHSYTELENKETINQILALTISFIILLGMLGIIYRGLDKPHIYSTITKQEKQIANEINQYANSLLTEDDAQQKLDHLVDFMLLKKPYKQENITIDKLAEMIEIPSRQLSQIINQKLNQNFFDFINSHRIGEAKQRLKSRSVRISEVMYEVGFSSRSSFNTAFKKYTKLTPSQYRKSIKSD